MVSLAGRQGTARDRLVDHLKQGPHNVYQLGRQLKYIQTCGNSECTQLPGIRYASIDKCLKNNCQTGAAQPLNYDDYTVLELGKPKT